MTAVAEPVAVEPVAAEGERRVIYARVAAYEHGRALPALTSCRVHEERERVPDPTRDGCTMTRASWWVSLGVHDVDALRAWAAHLDSTDLEPVGPHRVGPSSFVTVTGCLDGIPAVLHAEVPHDHPTDLERVEACELLRLRELDGPPTADHDTAGWRAAIDAADAAARQTPTEQL